MIKSIQFSVLGCRSHAFIQSGEFPVLAIMSEFGTLQEEWGRLWYRLSQASESY